MSVENLLSQLSRVKVTGKGQWRACCPAHESKSQSLSIRECDDGRVLLKCFAECAVESVLAAVGMTFSDLYPDTAIPGVKRERRPFSHADALRNVDFEATVVAVAAENIAAGVVLSADDRARLVMAAQRINSALGACS